MLALLAYCGIIFFFLRLMRLLHQRDRDAVAHNGEHQHRRGFVEFLDQVRPEA